MNRLQIPFGTQITLKNKFNSKYLGFKYTTQTLAASFPPPITNIAHKHVEPVDMALKLRIASREGQNNNLVTQGSRVYLVHTQTKNINEINSDEYLTCSSRGQLKFDKKSINQDMNKMLFKSASWTISYASFQKQLISSSKNPLSPYDYVVIKSVYGTYLTMHSNTLACSAILQMDQERSVWQIQMANSILLPNWVFQKPSFAKYLKAQQIGQSLLKEKKNLKSQNPQIQQILLVQDLLDVMLGFQGTYIKRRPGSQYFVIQPHLQNPSCNVSLAQLAYRIVQLPTHYQRLMKFISQLQYRQSLLAQALCGGLRQMVYQYYHQVNQLDEKQGQSGLSLQIMWVQIQDSLKIMRALGQLITSAANLRGGQFISCLLKLINQTTDSQILNIYRHLFHKLISLYVVMLSKWIYEGEVDDKYGEFMIVVQESSSEEWNNWDQRFLLRNQLIPSILQRDAKNILITGKYLNILKACNREIKCPFAKEIQTNIQHHINKLNFTEPIQRAYQWANQQLLQLIFQEHKLQDLIYSLKGYYFLSYGDLFLHFLDAAQDDLITQKKTKNDSKVKPFSIQKLQNLFDLNVRTSSAANDPYKEDISLRLDTATIFEQIYRLKTMQSEIFAFNFDEKPFIKKDSRYVDFVTLDFKCSFPLNFIFNKKNISKYQCIFRFMFWFKFLQRQLNSCWIKLQSTKESNVQCFKRAYITNHKIVNFIKSFVYYLSEEVIQQNWIKLNADFKKAKNFQEIITYHQNFLNNCLKQSLLTNQFLLQILSSQIGTTIHNYLSIKTYLGKIQDELITFKQMKQEYSIQRKEYMKHLSNQVNDLIQVNHFTEFINTSIETFNQVLKKFIRQVNLSTRKEQNHLLRLSQMLDQQNHLNRRDFLQ